METLVKTKLGTVKGLHKESKFGDKYFSFQKIPFAKPPVENLRFKAPVEPEPWTEVLDCTHESKVPYYQETHFPELVPSEDCLYLNVYSKSVSE